MLPFFPYPILLVTLNAILVASSERFFFLITFFFLLIFDGKVTFLAKSTFLQENTWLAQPGQLG